MKFVHHIDHFHVKKHVVISSLGIIFGFLLYNYFAKSTETISSGFAAAEAVLASLTGVLVSYVTYFLSKKMDGLIPWSTQLAARFLTGIIIQFLVAFLLISFLSFAYIKFDVGDAPEIWQSTLIKLAILLFLIMLLYTIVYFALYSYYSYATLQIENVRYDRRQIELQLKALKSQLGSHFLFNNLNTISSLVFKDPEASETYIRGLAKVYKYSLNSYHSKLVSLEEELAMLESYLLLLKTRYGPFFNYSLHIDAQKLSSKVPPLTLQMLVENAVKHNIMNAENVLRINISSDKDLLIVANNLTGAPKHVNSFHIGLKNIEARYQLLRKKGISIEEETDFIVKIPLIQ
ncbi:MAG: histidine kinase [Bacteroidota bacterium]